jgi:hypothetical protein
VRRIKQLLQLEILTVIKRRDILQKDNAGYVFEILTING